jgi:TPR repeat protein
LKPILDHGKKHLIQKSPLGSFEKINPFGTKTGNLVCRGLEDFSNLKGEFFFEKGIKFSDAGNYLEAFSEFNKSANFGFLRAYNAIGVLYHEGKGFIHDEYEACRWFRIGALQGCNFCQLNLGKQYYHGRGVDLDFQEAQKWFLLSAAQGNSDAKNYLGVIYFNGQGVAQNYREAVRWYCSAIRCGSANAPINLGGMYFHGFGVQRNLLEAIYLYSLAATKDESIAQDILHRLGRLDFRPSYKNFGIINIYEINLDDEIISESLGVPMGFVAQTPPTA